MTNPVQEHYQKYPYPRYPLLASVPRRDTYALNLKALWTRFNRNLPREDPRILIAGCGTFSPYPFAVANPGTAITALDISERSLSRARLHCLLHGRRNVSYICGDILDGKSIQGEFALIDSYGVLHHLDDPVAGLMALEKHLMPGGIIRIMLYSRYARREEESIRRALRLLDITTPAAARKLLDRARPGSRLARFLSVADETGTDCGLADALLHPRVRTYRIDELLELVSRTGLRPLLFAHAGAREDVAGEIERLRQLEKERRSPGNFVLYLGIASGNTHKTGLDSLIVLNPCLKSAIRGFTPGTIRIPARIGLENPPLGRQERGFLGRFAEPVYRSTLDRESAEEVEKYKKLLFLLEYYP
ncbi:MAG: SAM-dependent methyltransferase [Geobacteraceae bacterium GWC2_55_20]|nr:MAG: SAM-dependent methyltransferase [Geobacteraceae bacterium GWC2_55_20]OGU20656.1 MAG: SAM-dependent methyltransferase [Geobacteraceae bacterium GWF2_54_21]HBA71253.1 SAM-dependent methyltransferase [Geobacter sp.]HCE67299.1 SAM-dependent methyltransferase [Geobacter sp.]